LTILVILLFFQSPNQSPNAKTNKKAPPNTKKIVGQIEAVVGGVWVMGEAVGWVVA
jgi:hypothetical protein